MTGAEIIHLSKHTNKCVGTKTKEYITEQELNILKKIVLGYNKKLNGFDAKEFERLWKKKSPMLHYLIYS